MYAQFHTHKDCFSRNFSNSLTLIFLHYALYMYYMFLYRPHVKYATLIYNFKT